MCRHFGHDDLLHRIVPGVVDPEAPNGIVGVAAALYLPVRFKPVTVKVELEAIRFAAAASVAVGPHSPIG